MMENVNDLVELNIREEIDIPVDVENLDGIKIRLATLDDAQAICDIYKPYVLTTAVTFDTHPPTVEETRETIERIYNERPFLVATEVDDDGNEIGIVGFAYAAAFRPRAAYIQAIETTVYLKDEYKGRGLGRRLYEALEEILRLQHVYTANACIPYAEPDDEFSPATTRLFHEKMGYEFCGRIPNCGRKFGRWYGIIWMQKVLLPLTTVPENFIPLNELNPKEVERVCVLA